MVQEVLLEGEEQAWVVLEAEEGREEVHEEEEEEEHVVVVEVEAREVEDGENLSLTVLD